MTSRRLRIVGMAAAATLVAGGAVLAAPRREPLIRMAVRAEGEVAAGKRAVVALEARSGSRASGKAEFVETNGQVKMTLVVEGLSEGAHAVHLHEKGDCSAPDATSAGPHWNPTSMAHGRWGEGEFHHGDIGNVLVGPDGRGSVTLTTDLWTIGGDPSRDIVGRAVIVHAMPDDFVTQPTGNAGGRIACGVVRAEP